jgi:hypothetical protein
VLAARVGDESDAGRELQCVAEDAREQSALARADPDDRRALQRPGRRRRAAVEGERDCEGTEREAERNVRLDQQAQARGGAPE